MPICKYCSKVLKTERGLKQHLDSSKCAPVHYQSLTHKEAEALDDGNDALMAVFGLDEEDMARPQGYAKRPNEEEDCQPKKRKAQQCFNAKEQLMHPRNLLSFKPKALPKVLNPGEKVGILDEEVLLAAASDDDNPFPLGVESDDDSDQVNVANRADDTNRSNFRSYCANAPTQFAPFDDDHRNAILLLDILRRKKAPLDTYEEVMKWHLRDKKELLEGQNLGDCDSYISRKVLLKKLKTRYNMDDKFPYQKEIVLPFSRAKVKVVCTNARDCIESLLTDPRLKDTDFDFVDNNPFAPPPGNYTYVAGAQTAEAYRKGHAAYVKEPGQVGAGVMWYIDGAVTGQFENLEITSLKISLTMFTREYRMKDHAWRTLGYVVNYSKADSRGKKIFADSNHIDSLAVAASLEEDEGEEADVGEVSEEKAQDFHAQLNTILRSYVQLQGKGMMWDLYYRGKVHKTELVFWTIMVRCDTDEAELLCGKFRMRTGKVKCLCRYCTCPREDTDNPKACYPFKTVPMIKRLMKENDEAGLKKISQQNLDNCWYKVRFHPGDRGIHGACPAEMLHAILLGIFKYSRECFFQQIGPKSQLALEINALAKVYGLLSAHQSERDMPKCKFSEGIRKTGKIMAKEYHGVLLVMAMILRSTEGQRLLRQNKNFRKEGMINDWLLMVEILLQWEVYLCEPRMELFHVRRLMHKNRFIMHILKKVAQRSKGMGLRLFKFHAIVHMALDILLFGVPMEQDTGSNESGHKVTKVAAKLTQKKASVFEIQTATRLAEFFLIELAMEELDGRPLWDYFNGFEHPPEPNSGPMDDDSQPTDEITATNRFDIRTGGAKMVVSTGNNGAPSWEMVSRSQGNKVTWNDDVRECLHDLQVYVANWMSQVPLYTEHKRNGHIFRSHPNFRGEGPWRDWALFDWGEEYGTLPCEIWGFVVLNGLPAVGEVQPPLQFAGIDLKDGTYALVESSAWSSDQKAIDCSDIFVPLQKEVGRLDNAGRVTDRAFYLADVEAIVKPLFVLPDIGATPKCKYFQVKPRSAWVADFVAWLEAPHEDDVLSDSEDESD